MSSTVLTTYDFYPLKDSYPKTIAFYTRDVKIMAVYSGVKRCPKQGEWYLSGVFIEAYKAQNDLSVEYPIAKIVLVKAVTSLQIVEVLEG